MVTIDTVAEQKSKNSDVVFDVDAEHLGVRLSGCVSFIGLGLISFFAGAFVLQNSFSAALVAFIVSAVGANVIERSLKGRWKSGRAIALIDDTITLAKQSQVERKLDAGQHINILMWHFVVKRSSRVKKGWHVVAVALEQNDDRISAYTFASPEEFSDMNHHKLFTKLEKEDKKDEKPKVSSMKRAGEQRRLFEAELERSVIGAELRLDQFIDFIDVLQEKYPDWMVS